MTKTLFPSKLWSKSARQSRKAELPQSTQTELKRLQLIQDQVFAQQQLAQIQSELRSLERQKPDRIIKNQIAELRLQEKNLKQRIQTLQSALAPAEPAAPQAGPATPYSKTPPPATAPQQPVRKRTPLSHKFFLISGASIFLSGSCLLLLFIIAQLGNENGATDNMTGFIGALVLCPVPIALLGAVLLVIGFVRLRKSKKAGES